VFDIIEERASAIASTCGNAPLFSSAENLITDESVDAVIIATPDETHAAITLTCIEERKPVLCEKPLATAITDARKVIEAECAAQRRLVMVGFMRRFDSPHLALKEAIDRGEIGRPKLFKGVHRNSEAPSDFKRETLFYQSAIHDIDSMRWLMKSEVEEVTVRGAHVDPKVDANARDMALITLSLRGGGLATIEAYVSANYGYEVSAEVVGDEGTIITTQPDQVLIRTKGARLVKVPEEWLARFDLAYINELNHWVKSLMEETTVGANAWDGYTALLVADACIQSLNSGQPVRVSIPEKPEIYH
jgi:myo-inositol 2-dehydrogenase/D-chiro-inositol 1-dehydrogenase